MLHLFLLLQLRENLLPKDCLLGPQFAFVDGLFVLFDHLEVFFGELFLVGLSVEEVRLEGVLGAGGRGFYVYLVPRHLDRHIF